MHVEVFLTGHHVEEEDLHGRAVVVIDVLRTSSTVAAALSAGARSVVPATDMAEAGKIAANLDPASYLMGGEKSGVRIEGYHLGNSPLEYLGDTVRGKTVILNTTNGTRAVSKARNADHLVIGCFLNASRTSQFLVETGLDVTVVCAGWLNRVSLEDTICAGLILYQLWDGVLPEYASDSARIAFIQYEHDRANLETAISRCNHALRLADMGLAEDVAYCSQVDALPVLPYFENSQLVLHRAPDAKGKSALPPS